MARHRTPTATEDLAAIERKYRGRPEQIRIRAIRLLNEQPMWTHRRIADTLGVSKPTIDRWWRIYRESGLEKVLAIGKERAPARASGSAPVLASRPIPARPDSESLLRLMNHLPQSLDVVEAIQVLRTELLLILPDVDRVLISVDTACDLIDPGSGISGR